MHAAPQCGHVKVAGTNSHQKHFFKRQKTTTLLKVIFYCYWKLNETMQWLNKDGFFMFGVILLKGDLYNGVFCYYYN